jgi:hypothetical protein
VAHRVGTEAGQTEATVQHASVNEKQGPITPGKSSFNLKTAVEKE